MLQGITSRGRRARQGFTLIELLVVIAVIAILAAILFPVFMKARETGKRASCLGNLKQLGYSISLYQEDFSGCMPARSYVSGGPDEYGQWVKWLREIYTKNSKIFHCPAASNPTVIYGIRISYGYNQWVFYGWNNSPDGNGRFVNPATFPNPKLTLLVADGCSTRFKAPLLHDWDDSEMRGDLAGSPGYGLPSGMNRCKFAEGEDANGRWVVRHGGSNVLFADLHAQNIPPEQFRALNYSADPSLRKEWPIMHPRAKPCR